MVHDYRPLDLTKNEIRILRFLKPEPEQAELVHCTLTHVSLDDVLPEFEKFKSDQEKSHEIPLKSHVVLKEWVRSRAGTALGMQSLTPNSPLAAPEIADWRYKVEYSAGAYKSLVKTLGLELKTPSLVLREDWTDPSPSVSTVPISPRFKWGDYETISYCWESDVRNSKVVVDGAIVDVPRNLSLLLQRIKNLPEAETGMGFWVDGLCINQDSISEKNHQMHLMQRIFSQSFANIVWLGESCAKSSHGMNLIAQTSDLYHTMNSINRDILLLWIRSVTWNNVYRVFRRPYWRRLWIIQELALNSHMTLFMCGADQLPREAILNAIVFCYGHNARSVSETLRQQRRDRKLKGGNDNFDTWHIAADIHRLFILSEGMHEDAYANLETVLDLSRKSNVKDPRDKVYGILGLLDPTLSAKITPDYTFSREVIYVKFAIAILESCQTLDGLLSWCSTSQAASHKNEAHYLLLRLGLHLASQPKRLSVPTQFLHKHLIPSWVPDWTKPFQRRHIQWLRNARASGQSEVQYKVINWGLHCKGVIIDEIQSTCFSPSQSDAYGKASETNFSPAQERNNMLAYLDSELYPKHKYAAWTGLAPREDLNPFWVGRDGIDLALDLTLLMAHPGAVAASLLDIYWIEWNHLDGIYRQSDTYTSPFWEFAMSNVVQPDEFVTSSPWEEFDRFRQRNADFNIFGKPFKSFFRSMRSYEPKHWTESRGGGGMVLFNHQPMVDDPQNLTADHARNVRLAAVGLRGRKLATTRTKYLGLVPEEACNGDMIAVLLGCNFPVVLRRFGRGFRYIGECYVAGIMEGEIMDAVQREEHELVDIILR